MDSWQIDPHELDYEREQRFIRAEAEYEEQKFFLESLKDKKKVYHLRSLSNSEPVTIITFVTDSITEFNEYLERNKNLIDFATCHIWTDIQDD